MEEIIDILEEVNLCIGRIQTYNDIIDQTNTYKVDGHGLNNNAPSILYGMTSAIEKDLKEITNKIEKIYEINRQNKK